MSIDTIYGIDLGTTNSCIAYVDEYGKPEVVRNMEGDETTPSVVYFENAGNAVVGINAKNDAKLHPGQVVELVKRHMGEANWRFPCNGVEYSPQEISSYILKKVVGDAAIALGKEIKKVVITCPAYFDIAQREATKLAGEMAGLDVLEIIDEPVAAAIDFGVRAPSGQNQSVLVYDLGGGTFDITVIKVENGDIITVATDGDHELGGRDWDERVVTYLADAWKRETGSSEDITDRENSPETLQELWLKAENAKKQLSSPGRSETKVTVTHNGVPASVTLTQETFDSLTLDLLERTITLTRATIDVARQRGVTRIDQLLLVGGSTRMKQVSERLRAEFGFEGRLYFPDLAVAQGAAIFGQKLAIGQRIKTIKDALKQQSGGRMTDAEAQMKAQQQAAQESSFALPYIQKMENMDVRKVASHSYGLIALDASRTSFTHNLILKNDPLPKRVTQRFGTASFNQPEVDIQVVENNQMTERVAATTPPDVVEIGVVNIPNLPPNLPEGSPIDVTFELDTQGLLVVVGVEPTSGKTMQGSFETKGSMSEEEVEVAKQRAAAIIVV